MKKNKTLIPESRSREIVLVIISFLFAVTTAFFIKDEYANLVFWITLIFFGGIGLILLIRLLNPDNIFAVPGSALSTQIIAEQLAVKQLDEGSFSFDQDSFNLKQYAGSIHLAWADIESLLGYKRHFIDDRCAIDIAGIDIFTKGNQYIKIDESLPGWIRFNKELSEKIPAVKNEWYNEIQFIDKRSLLFDKKGRSMAEVEKLWYENKE